MFEVGSRKLRAEGRRNSGTGKLLPIFNSHPNG